MGTHSVMASPYTQAHKKRSTAPATGQVMISFLTCGLSVIRHDGSASYYMAGKPFLRLS